MFYHDTHLHLDLLAEFEGLVNRGQEELTASQQQSLVNWVENLLQPHKFAIHSTVSTNNWQKVNNWFQDISKVYFLLGSHPEEVDENFSVKDYLDKQQQVLNSYTKSELIQQRTLGIGEVGLDYHYTEDKGIWQKQWKLFESQIQLAIDWQLPLVIHCRDAFSDLLDILQNFPQIHGSFLVHCFTGDVPTLERVLEMQGRAAFGGILTFGKSAEPVREAFVSAPEKAWMIETDLPFLSPKPKRGQACLPEYVAYTAYKMSELKQTDPAQIWDTSEQNAREFFHLTAN
jgi:TatD DNase family protein